MVLRLFWVALAMISGACALGPSHDPAFESTGVFESSPAACGEPGLCVEVRAPVVGNRPGVGSCAVYGPGDPKDSKPLVKSGDLEMRPGDLVTWAAKVPDGTKFEELNPVCQPMVEG